MFLILKTVKKLQMMEFHVQNVSCITIRKDRNVFLATLIDVFNARALHALFVKQASYLNLTNNLVYLNLKTALFPLRFRTRVQRKTNWIQVQECMPALDAKMVLSLILLGLVVACLVLIIMEKAVLDVTRMNVFSVMERHPSIQNLDFALLALIIVRKSQLMESHVKHATMASIGTLTNKNARL